MSPSSQQTKKDYLISVGYKNNPFNLKFKTGLYPAEKAAQFREKYIFKHNWLNHNICVSSL